MNNNFYTNYHLLNCTQEVSYCLEEAKKIAILTNDELILRPIHLCLSLIFNSKLIDKILTIKHSRIDKKNILKLIFNIKELKEEKKNDVFFLGLKSIDKNILNILSILNTSQYPFNTLTLFYYLCKQNPGLIRFLFSIFRIEENNINNYFAILKTCLEKPLPKLIIPNILKDVLKIMKGNNKVIGRETEVENIVEVLDRNLNRNIILLGNEGIGKTTIVKKLISRKPSKIFLELNITFLISYKDDTAIINELFDFIKKYNNIIIIFCKNFHLLFDYSKVDLSLIRNSLLDLLSLNKLQIIGTSLTNYYDKITETDERIKFLFSKIFIKELENSVILLIMKQYLSSNKIDWINDNILKNIIDLSEKFIKNYVFPQKGFLILDSLLNKNKKKLKKNISRKDLLNIIAQYSELPSNLILKNTNDNLKISEIDSNLKKYVFGQDIAVLKIASSLKRAYAGLKDKNKPIGSWLLCGPSGTGKTELVKSLAFLLFGSEKELIRFDMSEFMEKHSVSKLIGSPPGYIGCDEGGLLTEAVKKKPYSVILFDEIEKAHKDINNIMLQLLDEGSLTDSRGQKIDFSNTLIIYTSNLGCPTSSIQFKSFIEGTELSEEEYKFLSKNVDTAVKEFFKPEFLNRLDSTIVFKPLSILCLSAIIDKFISKLEEKLQENSIFLKIEIDRKIKSLLAKLSYHPLYGARPLKRVIEQFIEKPLSELIMQHTFKTPHIFSIYQDEKRDTIGYSIQNLKKN